MNGNLELLVREIQEDRTRDLERRMLAARVRPAESNFNRRERAMLWAGGLLVQWGRRLQASSDSREPMRPVASSAKLLAAAK